MKAFLVFRVLDLILMITYGAALAYYTLRRNVARPVPVTTRQTQDDI